MTVAHEQKVARKKVKTAIERANYQTEKAISYMAFEDLDTKSSPRQDIGYQEKGRNAR